MSEALRGSHINRLFHLQRCATVCVIEVEEGGEAAAVVVVYRGVVRGKWQSLTVHLFEKCEQENVQNNSEQILSPEKKKQCVYEAIEFAVSVSLSRFSL